MDYAEYVGPPDRAPNDAEKALIGKRALVKPDATYDLPLDKRTLLAQFDGDWRARPELELVHPVTGEYLRYSWHTFPVTHFHLLVGRA